MMRYDKVHLLKDVTVPATSVIDTAYVKYSSLCGMAAIWRGRDFCSYIDPDRMGGYNPDCICKNCKKAWEKRK